MPVTVSIVLPTYNRARFLPQAFASIRGQTFADWDLIVVDDGSKDNTRELVEAFATDVPQTVSYVYQENQGAYAARNTGVARAQGRYLAFFDSDDQWLPHHLQDCVVALEANSEVDWVYGAGRQVRYETGEILGSHSFYPGGQPRPLLNLRSRLSGKLHVIEDPDAVRCQLLHGLYCGFQNSVIRSTVFQNLRIPPFRIGEDRAFVILALKSGYRIGYIDDVHVVYHVHDGNCSSANSGVSLDKRVDTEAELIRCYEAMEQLVSFNGPERRAWRKALSQEFFWHLGYALLWCNGRRRHALPMFRRGLRLWPFELRYWKTYLLALVRSRMSPGRVPAP
jgi:glycosyltransferase involved in cell wall biosynthesis